MRRVYLDVATTGMTLSDRIIEIALVEEVDEKLTGARFNCLVNPQGRPMSEAASRVTGHHDDQLKQFPVFSEILDQLLGFIGSAELVCWDVRCDLAFLNAELARFGRLNVNSITCCTLGADMRSKLKKQAGARRPRSHLHDYLDPNLTWLQSNCIAMAKLHSHLDL